MSVTIEVTGNRGWKSIADMPQKFREAIQVALVKSISHVRTKVIMSGRVPYKTGNLRRSITISSPIVGGGDSVQVGSNLDYAPVHEYGGTFTRHKAFGKPTKPYTVTYRERAFIRVPFAQSVPTIGRIFDQEIGRVAKLS